jgi:hypothetical protein
MPPADAPKRRLLLLGGALLGGCERLPYLPAPRRAASDADPYDQPGRGRAGFGRAGLSDADPYDQPGRNRRGMAGQADSDATDAAAGAGSDADAYDLPGHGGPRRRGGTDSDPVDRPAGR